MEGVEPLNDAGKAHLDQLHGLTHADRGDGVELGDLVVPTDDPVVAELVRQLIADGQLSNEALEQAGKRCGVTGRTMRNRVNRLVHLMVGDTPISEGGWELTSEVLEVVAAHRGRIAPAYEDLRSQGFTLPSPSTMWRRWHDLPAAFRGFVRDGKAGMLPAWAYVPYTAPHPNAVWQGDYVPLPVDVIPFGHETTEVMPYILIFEDDHTRAVVAWSVECRPNRRGTGERSTATLALGFEGTEVDGVRIGGIPDMVRVDNDAAFLCHDLAAMAATIGFDIKAVPPYSPFLKGKVEGIARTLQNELVMLMQGYTHGPLSYTGRNPFRDAGPITEATLIRFLHDWFHHYNHTRIHTSLEHGTPLRQWAAGDHPIRWADPKDLRAFQFPIDRDYKVHKHGIWWDGGHWTGPGITNLIGRTVTFRYPLRPQVDRIEVFSGDVWKMTAWRAETLTEDQRREILQERHHIYTQAIDLVEDAAARRNDATADAAVSGGRISPAAAPDADAYAADTEALWDIVGDDPTPATSATDGTDGTDGPEHDTASETSDEDPVRTGATKRPRRRNRRRKTPSRRRPERPDTTPSDDLWELFAHEDEGHGDQEQQDGQKEQQEQEDHRDQQDQQEEQEGHDQEQRADGTAHDHPDHRGDAGEDEGKQR